MSIALIVQDINPLSRQALLVHLYSCQYALHSCGGGDGNADYQWLGPKSY